ncbi:hypothetical protein [Microbacterium sp. KR10-403]|uniref:hypothetical protein n=1 Tax=Microbacterium sp. KR10-403 TaxID=3158581 RepID=UPI0032E3DF16
MTDDTNGTQTPAGAPQTAVQAPEAPGGVQGVSGAQTGAEGAADDLAALPADRLAAMLREKRRDEASVRDRLRAAKTERDQLAATVQAFQTDALQALAVREGLAATARGDLAQHIPTGEVVDAAGLLDEAAALARIEQLRTDRPHLFVARVAPANTGGTPATGDSRSSGQAASWADVLHG